MSLARSRSAIVTPMAFSTRDSDSYRGMLLPRMYSERRARLTPAPAAISTRGSRGGSRRNVNARPTCSVSDRTPAAGAARSGFEEREPMGRLRVLDDAKHLPPPALGKVGRLFEHEPGDEPAAPAVRDGQAGRVRRVGRHKVVGIVRFVGVAEVDRHRSVVQRAAGGLRDLGEIDP